MSSKKTSSKKAENPEVEAKPDGKVQQVWGQVFLTSLGAIIQADKEARIDNRGRQSHHIDEALKYADTAIEKINQLGS